MESHNIDNKKAIVPQEMIIYQSEDGAVKVDVQMADETVWLTIDGMVNLFGKSRSTINEHILHIFEKGELSRDESVRKIGNSDFSTKPTNYYNLDVIMLRAMGQIVSGYLDFAERQAERQKAMTMKDWATHLDNILTMSGEKLLQGAGKVSHQEAIDHATQEYKKYQQRTLSQVEKDYLDNIKSLPTK